jgi:NhaC family Na+:H+ antiporter
MRKPTIAEAFVPLFFLVILLSINVYSFADNSLTGSNQLVLVAATALAGMLNYHLGVSWENMLAMITNSIHAAMPAMLILLMIGSLSGAWLLGGIVPAMIYYGLQLLHPAVFLFAACIIAAIVSLATGSSWSTVATVGVALMGISRTLGFEDGLTAGAIISGAYFGDKLSPLSDTTNLAPAVSGTNLFTHIRYMFYTTIPTFTLTLVIFLVIGFWLPPVPSADVSAVLTELDSIFDISLWLFVVPLITFILIAKNVPALPAMAIGIVGGVLSGLIFQQTALATLSTNSGSSLYQTIMKGLYGSTAIVSENIVLAGLLQSKGMAGMLNTVWLIVCAMSFGGMLEAGGMLARITEAIASMATSVFSLIAATVGTCIFLNITTSDQYLSIAIGGRMYAATFRKRGLAPENLSRTLEDSGTVTSVLVPWNTCGATQATVLGVATMTYLPYCFFNLLSPITTLLFAAFDIKIKRTEAKTIEE